MKAPVKRVEIYGGKQIHDQYGWTSTPTTTTTTHLEAGDAAGLAELVHHHQLVVELVGDVRVAHLEAGREADRVVVLRIEAHQAAGHGLARRQLRHRRRGRSIVVAQHKLDVAVARL